MAFVSFHLNKLKKVDCLKTIPNQPKAAFTVCKSPPTSRIDIEETLPSRDYSGKYRYEADQSMLFYNSLVGQVSEGAMQVKFAFGVKLVHHDSDDFILRVYPKAGVEKTTPVIYSGGPDIS